MKLNVFFIFLLLTSTYSFAGNSGDLISALYDADFSEDTEDITVEAPEQKPKFESSSSEQKVCTKKDQITVPYKILKGLLKNKKLDFTHDPTTGELEIDGGLMVSNCNDMLSFDFAKPKNDLPYLFQVSIKKPEGCSTDKCKYSAYTAEDGIANDELLELNLEPTLDGYIECLEKTKVFKGGKISEDNIVWHPLTKSVTGANETADIWFSSHGPEAARRGGVYSDNLKKGMGCYHFEQVNREPLTLYSEADTEKNKKYDYFQIVCKYKNYNAINEQIRNFEGYKELQQELINIRNKNLEDRIKQYHRMLQADDLSGIDPAAFKEATGDFLKYIIEPLISNMDKVYSQYQKATGDKKKQLLSLLNTLSEKLLTYGKAPYIDTKDYNKMKSFNVNAPLDNADWRDAAYYVYQLQNLGYHYGSSFNKDFQKKVSGKLVSTTQIKRDFKSDIEEQRQLLSQLGQLASDPNKSFYSDHMKVYEQINQQASNYKKEHDNLKRQGIQRYVMQTCSYVAQNQYSFQACARDTAATYQDIMEEEQYVMDDFQNRAASALRDADRWRKIESQIPGRSQKQFSFNPNSPTNPRDKQYIYINGRVVDPADIDVQTLAQIQASGQGQVVNQQQAQALMIQRFYQNQGGQQVQNSSFNFNVPQFQGRSPAQQQLQGSRMWAGGTPYFNEAAYSQQLQYLPTQNGFYMNRSTTAMTPWNQRVVNSSTGAGGRFSFSPTAY